MVKKVKTTVKIQLMKMAEIKDGKADWENAKIIKIRRIARCERK